MVTVTALLRTGSISFYRRKRPNLLLLPDVLLRTNLAELLPLQVGDPQVVLDGPQVVEAHAVHAQEQHGIGHQLRRTQRLTLSTRRCLMEIWEHAKQPQAQTCDCYRPINIFPGNLSTAVANQAHSWPLPLTAELSHMQKRLICKFLLCLDVELCNVTSTKIPVSCVWTSHTPSNILR